MKDSHGLDFNSDSPIISLKELWNTDTINMIIPDKASTIIIDSRFNSPVRVEAKIIDVLNVITNNNYYQHLINNQLLNLHAKRLVHNFMPITLPNLILIPMGNTNNKQPAWFNIKTINSITQISPFRDALTLQFTMADQRVINLDRKIKIGNNRQGASATERLQEILALHYHARHTVNELLIQHGYLPLPAFHFPAVVEAVINERQLIKVPRPVDEQLIQSYLHVLKLHYFNTRLEQVLSSYIDDNTADALPYDIIEATREIFIARTNRYNKLNFHRRAFEHELLHFLMSLDSFETVNDDHQDDRADPF